MARPLALALGAHIQCLCGAKHSLSQVARCEIGNDRAVWAKAAGVKRRTARSWSVDPVDGAIVRGNWGRAAIGFQLRSYNAKARLYGMETITP